MDSRRRCNIASARSHFCRLQLLAVVPKLTYPIRIADQPLLIVNLENAGLA